MGISEYVRGFINFLEVLGEKFRGFRISSGVHNLLEALGEKAFGVYESKGHFRFRSVFGFGGPDTSGVVVLRVLVVIVLEE